MLQRDGVVMVKMKVLVMMVMKMLIPMKPSLMAMTMATISPLQEGIFLADFCLPESFLSLSLSLSLSLCVCVCVCFPPCRGSGVYL
jgi:hypothetical protein